MGRSDVRLTKPSARFVATTRSDRSRRNRRQSRTTRLAELKALDAGSWFANASPDNNCRFSSLEKASPLVRQDQISISVSIARTSDAELLAQHSHFAGKMKPCRVVSTVRTTSPPACEGFRRRRRECSSGHPRTDGAGDRECALPGSAIVRWRYTPAFCREFHDRGIMCKPTSRLGRDNPNPGTQRWPSGADYVSTDVPASALRVLNQRSSHSRSITFHRGASALRARKNVAAAFEKTSRLKADFVESPSDHLADGKFSSCCTMAASTRTRPARVRSRGPRTSSSKASTPHLAIASHAKGLQFRRSTEFCLAAVPNEYTCISKNARISRRRRGRRFGQFKLSERTVVYTAPTTAKAQADRRRGLAPLPAPASSVSPGHVARTRAPALRRRHALARAVHGRYIDHCHAPAFSVATCARNARRSAAYRKSLEMGIDGHSKPTTHPHFASVAPID